MAVGRGDKNEIGNDLIKIKTPRFSNDTNFTITQFGIKFDFIYAHSVFTHASRSQIKRCLHEAKKSMKPTSVFAATFCLGDENYTGEEWVYPSCATYTLERISEYCCQSGLQCNPVKWSHRNQTLLVITDPAGSVQIPREIPDKMTIDALYSQLEDSKNRLKKLQTHPCIKFGSLVNRTVRT